MLEKVLDLQRALSRARTSEDLLFEFADKFREVSGVAYALDLDVRDLGPGEFRVMNQLDMTPTEIDRDELLRCIRWDDPIEEVPVCEGGAVSRLIQSGQPMAFRSLDPAADEVLRGWLPGPMDGIAAPIFFGGEVCEWIVLFRPPGRAIEPIEARLGIANMNILARHAVQLKQTDEIDRLRAQLEADLRGIGDLQRALLPGMLPALDGYEMAVRYEPCDHAGGDYYDFRHFPSGQLGIVLADVSGHGARAAVVMAMLRTAMGAYRILDRPAETVVEDINALMIDVLSEGMFVTALFVALNPKTGTLRVLNSGHCYPLIRRASGVVEEIEGGGPPLGILPELSFEDVRARLDPGDALVLYTDGITEAFSPAMELFGVDRLRAALGDCGGNAEEILWDVLEAVDDHAAGRPRADDQCLLVVRRAV